MTTPTRSEVVAADVDALLRARNPVLMVVTREEARVEGYLMEAAAAAGYVPRTWDTAQGVAGMDGKIDREFSNSDDVGAALNIILERTKPGRSKNERGVWIMRDLPTWLGGGIIGARTLRQVRNLARTLPGVPREQAQAIIILSPSSEIPAELAGHATVIEWPLPDRAEIAAILDAAIESLPDEMKADAAPNGTRDAAIDAAIGLAGEEAQACFAKSLVQHRRIDPASVAQEKKRIIAREKVLEWYDPIPNGLGAVGGLENLKSWLLGRSVAYSPAARKYGLPSPKGVLLIGISGCGKTLIGKAISTAWQCPLLKFDFGALKSKFVGESETMIRRAYKVVEAIGRCVVWIDEVDKMLPTTGSADGGVSADALGSFLTWMQERRGDAFVVATANDIAGLPPEFMRKGRFDEVWWVDLPNAEERVAVLSASLRLYGRDPSTIAPLVKVADACDGFTGSEIAAIVPDALFTAFADGAREPNAADLIKAAKTVVPLSETAKEKIESMRKWAKGRARPATKVDTDSADKPRRRVLDIA